MPRHHFQTLSQNHADSRKEFSSSLVALSTLRFASSHVLVALVNSMAMLCARRVASADAALAFLKRSSASRLFCTPSFAVASAFFCAASKLLAAARAAVSDFLACCNKAFAPLIRAWRSFCRLAWAAASRALLDAVTALFEGLTCSGSAARLVMPALGVNEPNESKPGGSMSSVSRPRVERSEIEVATD